MRKKLVHVGNSLALLIEKPVRRMMGFSPQLEVDVRFDGRRLIVEAVEASPSNTNERIPAADLVDDGPLPLAMILQAGAVAHELLERFELTPQYLEKLYPGCARPIRYVSWAKADYHLQSANAAERAVVRRMHVCWEQLVLGSSWVEAIAVALYAVPLPQQT